MVYCAVPGMVYCAGESHDTLCPSCVSQSEEVWRRVKLMKLRFATSKLADKTITNELLANCRLLGAEIVSEWTSSCTHLVMSRAYMTAKASPAGSSAPSEFGSG